MKPVAQPTLARQGAASSGGKMHWLVVVSQKYPAGAQMVSVVAFGSHGVPIMVPPVVVPVPVVVVLEPVVVVVVVVVVLVLVVVLLVLV